MEKIKQILKDYWKAATTVVAVIGIFTAVVTFDARYAKSTEVQQLDQKKTIEIKKVEKDTVETLKSFKKCIESTDKLRRLESMDDQLMKLKILIKTYPKDQELKDDYNSLKEKRDKIKDELEKHLIGD